MPVRSIHRMSGRRSRRYSSGRLSNDWRGGLWCWRLSGLVDDVDMVQKGVQGLDARDGDSGLDRDFDGRAQIRFDFHRSLRHEVLVHSALVLSGHEHRCHCRFLEVGRERAFLCGCNPEELIHYVVDHLADAHFFDELCVRWSLEQDARWMKGDGPDED